MRLIGTLDNEQQGAIFSNFLNKKGIDHHLEVSVNRDWGSVDYGASHYLVWIVEEDQLEAAMDWFNLFSEHPDDPLFDRPKIASFIPLPKTPPSLKASPAEKKTANRSSSHNRFSTTWDQQSMGIITRSLLMICCLLFFLAPFLAPIGQAPANSPALFSSPIEKLFLYDYPYKYELISKLLRLYGDEAIQHPSELPTEGRALIQTINETPSWPGVYSIIKKQGLTKIPEVVKQTPMFERIKAGEIWRLFSPCLLHADIFHLFFNMLWLIVVGKQIEQRLKPLPYILFILIVGVVSNTSQYLVGGPNFIGFSGVLCGMIAFIWTRQRQAPWEGYQLDRMTLLFITLFIIGMAFLQTILFIFENSTEDVSSAGLANTAHLAGAFTGLLLGRLNFFSWRQA